MRTLIWYEAIQVVSRRSDGAVAEWYPADANERKEHRWAAIEERNRLAKEFPDTEYTVIETRIVECGQPRIGQVKAINAKKVSA